jgi:hypothetical protein
MGTVQNSILALVMEWGNPKAWAIHLDAMLLAAVYGVRISKFSCTFFFVLFCFFGIKLYRQVLHVYEVTFCKLQEGYWRLQRSYDPLVKAVYATYERSGSQGLHD